MTDQEYRACESSFRNAAERWLEQLKGQLVAMGWGPFSATRVVDYDLDLGLEFSDVSDNGIFVSLRLVDGDQHDFSGLALSVDCSVFYSGVVWGFGAPGERAEARAGMTLPAEVARRVEEIPLREVSEAIVMEWGRIRDGERIAKVQKEI